MIFNNVDVGVARRPQQYGAAGLCASSRREGGAGTTFSRVTITSRRGGWERQLYEERLAGGKAHTELRLFSEELHRRAGDPGSTRAEVHGFRRWSALAQRHHDERAARPRALLVNRVR